MCVYSLAYCTGLAGSKRNKTGYESFQPANPGAVHVTEGKACNVMAYIAWWTPTKPDLRAAVLCCHLNSPLFPLLTSWHLFFGSPLLRGRRRSSQAGAGVPPKHRHLLPEDGVPHRGPGALRQGAAPRPGRVCVEGPPAQGRGIPAAGAAWRGPGPLSGARSCRHCATWQTV